MVVRVSRRRLLNAAHLHAEVIGLQVDRHAMRLEHCLQRVGDLLADPFLHRKALSEEADEPRQFGDANDLLVGDVPDVGVPVEWQGVVLTERVELYGSLDNLA